MRLRFPDCVPADLVLCPGVHAIGRDDEGLPCLVDEPGAALAQFCVDRRGVWLQLRDGARGVHVNGRPVRRMAMLRAGDAVYFDGVELLLLGEVPKPAASRDAAYHARGDARTVLRGVGGVHHGRCFSLDSPRRVGRAADCDIRIAESAFALQHAVIEPHDEGAVLRGIGSSAGILVNGHPIRDALLRPGDQIVFDAHHRFVVESPRCVAAPAKTSSAGEDDDAAPARPWAAPARASSIRRLPWLLLAALMLSAALSLLLMYGAR